MTDAPTGAPTEQPTGEATEPPTGSPTGAPTDTPAPSPGGAAACSGNDENRAFYAAVAEAVTWDVYCAVLPAGWFVDEGSFRLAGGGKLEIAYKGPGGQRIEMRQGTYCVGVDGCIPTGSDAGAASYGDRPGRLLDVGGGAWLVVAEGGEVELGGEGDRNGWPDAREPHGGLRQDRRVVRTPGGPFAPCRGCVLSSAHADAHCVAH